MKVDHLEVFALAESLHRQFLDVVQTELDASGYRDLGSVRAMILYNVADLEMTASELMWRGCYLGSNVSYNLKKLTEAGYIQQVRSLHDKRVIMIRNTESGLRVCREIARINERHQAALSMTSLQTEDVSSCVKVLGALRNYWVHAVRPSGSGFVLAVAA